MVGVELEKAIEWLENEVSLIDAYEAVPLEAALGRSLAMDFYAPINQPPFDRSPLDGIAIRAQDTEGATLTNPRRLKIVGTIFAGSVYERKLESGEAVRIMTGAPLPQGCNAVIRQEDLNFEGDEVEVYKSVVPYSNYCYEGEDIKEGTLLIEKDTLLQSIQLGILASMGCGSVKVKCRLKVGIMSTGDELMIPGQTLKSGKIYNANTTLLAARLRELGMEPLIVEAQQDEAQSVAEALIAVMPRVDIMLTTGGVSVGQKDIMHEVVECLGAKRIFWRVKMQPGTPMLAMKFKNQLILCLSGNPFAALATFELIARPVLGKMSGQVRLYPVRTEGILKGSFEKASPKRRMIRAFFEAGEVSIPEHHASGVLSSMVGCNCLIDIQPDTPKLEDGTRVQIIKL